MPLYEYECPKHGVFERILPRLQEAVECACGQLAQLVWSRPAKRNPDHGIQR